MAACEGEELPMRELLADCLVDGDADVSRQGKNRRRRAMIVSAAVEAVLLAGLLVWPLITPGVIPAHYVMTPLPPYRAGGGHRPATLQPADVRHTCCPANAFHFPVVGPVVSTHSFQTDAAPDISSVGEGPGDRNSPADGVPWSLGNTAPIVRPPESRPPEHPAVIRRSEGAMLALLVHRVEPVYPPIALATHLTGTVRLQAVISTDGAIERLQVLSGNPILAQAALKAVQQWRYQPALLNGQAVEVETFITVNFIVGR